MSEFSTFLFARPGFIGGMARVFDLFGLLNTYNISTTPLEADYKAIRSDWKAVGSDMWSAVEQYERENEQTLKTSKPTEDHRCAVSF